MSKAKTEFTYNDKNFQTLMSKPGKFVRFDFTKTDTGKKGFVTMNYESVVAGIKRAADQGVISYSKLFRGPGSKLSGFTMVFRGDQDVAVADAVVTGVFNAHGYNLVGDSTAGEGSSFWTTIPVRPAASSDRSRAKVSDFKSHLQEIADFVRVVTILKKNKKTNDFSATSPKAKKGGKKGKTGKSGKGSRSPRDNVKALVTLLANHQNGDIYVFTGKIWRRYRNYAGIWYNVLSDGNKGHQTIDDLPHTIPGKQGFYVTKEADISAALVSLHQAGQ